MSQELPPVSGPLKILSITAQKPHSTGSGVYLTELVQAFHRKGCRQAVLAGICQDDSVCFPDSVSFYPVYYQSEQLPFPICGMSDEMPYKSTRYQDLTPEMTEQFFTAFRASLNRALAEFQPDLILCHHLYLLTAMARERFKEQKIYGFCHNTDLRQMKKTGLWRDYIREQIRGLDAIFVPQSAQKEGVMEIFGIGAGKIRILGMGYSQEIFCGPEKPDNAARGKDGAIRLIYAGKIAEKKGVKSLIKSLSYLPYPRDGLKLSLAGGAGNKTEYQEIEELALKAPYPVEFLGKLPQPELAKEYQRSDIFVLPSFFDGLPLTVIEAIACGDKVVVTDLPGIQDWLKEQAPGAVVKYVPLPVMRNTDEAVSESLPAFEKQLAAKIEECAREEGQRRVDLSHLSWKNICKEILKSS